MSVWSFKVTYASAVHGCQLQFRSPQTNKMYRVVDSQKQSENHCTFVLLNIDKIPFFVWY